MTEKNIYSPYKESDLIHVERGLIFFCKAGSHAYGLNAPDSDLDLRGIYIGPPEHVFGISGRVEQYDKFKFVDTQIWELRKFLRLASQCNPNMIEILFTPENAIIYSGYEWEMLTDIRDLFLSKQTAGKFCGYADGQLKRMRGHRKWINREKRGIEKLRKSYSNGIINEEWLAEHFSDEVVNKVMEREKDR